MRPSLLARLASCVTIMLLLAPGAHAAPVAYRLDPESTFAWFELRHFGTSTIRGRFGPLGGYVRMDAAAGSGELAIEIDTATVDTGLPAFDARIRKPDLLASEANPKAWFVSRRFSFQNGHPAEVRGEFTFRGVSQPLSLIADRFACGHDAERQREVCGGDFHGEFNRSEFGMTFGLPFVGNRVRLVVQVEGVRE
jgi:polyisoprenoid-binding protein YceI